MLIDTSKTVFNEQKNSSRMFLNSYKYLFISGMLISNFAGAQKHVFPIVTKTTNVSIVYDDKASALDSISANLLADDIERVTASRPIVMTDIEKAKGNIIVIGAIQSPLIKNLFGVQSTFAEMLNGKWESFGLTVLDKPLSAILKALVITGSDDRGTAYGVFTISEKIGVSPWYWWADVPAKKQTELVITQNDFISAPPAVKYRGIFINDEDWGGCNPGAQKHLNPRQATVALKLTLKYLNYYYG